MSIRIMTAAAAVAVMTIGAPMPASAQRGNDGNLPGGTYGQTCSNARVTGGRLYADCGDARGNRRATSIEIAPCDAGTGFHNDNGLLICSNGRGRFESNGGGGNNGGGWGGGNGGGNNGGGWGGGNGGGSITVYRDANFRGLSQTFSGEIANLGRSGFNDAISSMEFRGRWEACTDANFRGRCQQFDDSVSDLARWRMNDEISSLRPVRGGRW